MPKMKSRSGARKRFKLTATGKVKRAKAFHRHILTSKTARRKRNLRKGTLVAPADVRAVRIMIQE